MIINNAESTATIIGDVQTNSVSIDINNIGFITQLLSTNLYSKPIDSFLREIVSNAWDSHVEVGNNEPILLEIGTDTEGRDYCRIQDFGIGLSPERFNEIYKNIGSSTKRGDNTQIGGFGIGRFSALAYSGTVYLTSNYKGVKYKYLMYKDGNIIKIDELFNALTTDRDGLEVMVYIKPGDVGDFKDGIKNQLIFFENLYISFDRHWQKSNIEFAEKFNNLKIKKYKNFSVNTFRTNNDTTLCLGKIQYPLNKYSLSNTKFKFDKYYPISVNFEIGDLEVTPNREQILYSKINVDKICKKLDAVQDELDEIINSQIKTDFTDYDEYIQVLKNSNTKIILFEEGDKTISFNCKINSFNITFNGQKYNENLTKLHDFIFDNSGLIREFLSFRMSDNKIFTKLDNFYIPSINDIYNNAISDYGGELNRKAYVANYSEMSNMAKDYIRQTAHNATFFFKKTKPYTIIRKLLVKLEQHNNRNSYNIISYDNRTLKIVIKHLFEKLSKIESFDNSKISKTFIANRTALIKSQKSKNGNVVGINWKEEINLYILRRSDRTSWGNISVTSDSERISMYALKNKWKKYPVIYSDKDDVSFRELFYIFEYINNNDFSKYRFVEIASTKKHLLKQFPNFIEFKDFMNVKYKKIRILATARLLKKRYPYIDTLYNTRYQLSQVSTTLGEVVEKLYNYIKDNDLNRYYCNYNPDLLQDIDKLCEDHNYYDEEMLGYFNQHHKLLENSKFITLIQSSVRDETVNFITDYVLARKLFMPNLDAVKKLKETTIFNKKENENN